jgi:endonuclease YncB( thermonuclease family)
MSSRNSRSTLPRVLLALAPALALLAASAVSGSPPAAADSVTYGTVVMVDDGDTIDVDIRGDGTSAPRRVRYIGVQAMELHTYKRDLDDATGECWAVEAGRFLERVAEGRRARLTSRLESSHKGSRLHRSVAVQRGGVWVDTGGLVIDAGLALPDTAKIEYLHNGDYMARAQQAAASGLGMWGDPTHCGVGPDQQTPIEVVVGWDAPGNDSANINGEYVELTNRGTAALPLGGWWLRENAYRGYKARGFVFPAGVTLAPGGSLRVHPGVGTHTATDLFWGLDEPIFENVSGAPRHMGDGAYLFDPQGDLRAWQMYLCRHACAATTG